MKRKVKRISFSKQNAEHIYEYLRFYWATDYMDDKKLWDESLIRQCGKFGCCPECEQIGERLEKFLGPDSVKFVDNLTKEYARKRKNENSSHSNTTGEKSKS